MKRFLILLFIVMTVFCITSIAITDVKAIEVNKAENTKLLIDLGLIGLVIGSQVQVKSSTFTYKNIIYNKGAVIEVSETEQQRLIGAYPFDMQLPVVTSSNLKKPAIPQEIREPQVNSGPINTNDLKAGGKKKEAPVPKAKSDEDLLKDMNFSEIKKLAKTLTIKIPFGVSKANLINLIIKKK